ncbi:MAG: tol-pal system protein YbgF [bacterium]
MSRRDRFDQHPEDRFVRGAYSLIDFLMLHKTVITVVVVIVLAGVLGVLAYRSHLKAYDDGALAAFETARSAEDYRRVAETYPGSASEPMALFYCARKFVDDKNYKGAIEMYSSFVQAYPSHSLVPNALAFCGMLLEQENKFQEAAAQYQSVVESHPQSFIAPMVLLNMGSCFEKLGNATEAQKAYEKIVSEYPASAWKDDAEARLGKLGIDEAAIDDEAKTPQPEAPENKEIVDN